MRICTICVRGGSKGVPAKNWRLLSGLPLYVHSINQARESGLFDKIVISSDAPEVLEHALDFGADMVVQRPADLATDTAGKVPAIAHAVESAEHYFSLTFDTCVDLDATSPLRLPEDIAGAVALLENSNCESVITGAEAHRSPYFNLVEEDEHGIVSTAKSLPQGVLRRQDAPKTYDMNASVYVWKRDSLISQKRVFFESTRIFVMPAERSFDIDSELDFKIVEMLMNEREK